MKRLVSMDEISDGKLYGLGDLVKADCGDCRGCSDCCRGMGSSIILDPLDVHRMTEGLGKSFDELSEDCLELNLVDKVILPNLKLAGGADESCTFLSDEGRCRIHSFRPGICRLFPLGRYYEGNELSYFLQIHECSRENRTKVKVKKWIDQPDARRYEAYILHWHYFLERLEEEIDQSDAPAGKQKLFCMYVLANFFRKPFDAENDFYQQFEERLVEACRDLF